MHIYIHTCIHHYIVLIACDTNHMIQAVFRNPQDREARPSANHMNKCIYVCVFMYVYLCMCIYAYVFMYVYVYVYVYV